MPTRRRKPAKPCALCGAALAPGRVRSHLKDECPHRDALRAFEKARDILAKIRAATAARLKRAR